MQDSHKILLAFFFINNIAIATPNTPKASKDVIAMLHQQIQKQTESYYQDDNKNVFESQIENKNDYLNVKSLVFITSEQYVSSSGFTGSGVLVKKGNQYQILTARHIALNAQANPNIIIYIFNIYGQKIGELNAHNITNIDYTTPQKNIETDSTFVDIKNIDINEINKMTPAKLASSSYVIQTEIHTSGISAGISGGPVFNSQNEVIGVVSEMASNNKEANIIETGELLKQNKKLKIINPKINNKNVMSNLIRHNILFKPMYKNVVLFISPIPDTLSKKTLDIKSIIGFPNMVGNIYHLSDNNKIP